MWLFVPYYDDYDKDIHCAYIHTDLIHGIILRFQHNYSFCVKCTPKIKKSGQFGKDITKKFYSLQDN